MPAAEFRVRAISRGAGISFTEKLSPKIKKLDAGTADPLPELDDSCVVWQYSAPSSYSSLLSMTVANVVKTSNASTIALSIALCALARPAGAASISPLSGAERTRMTGASWKPGCPVPLDDLVSVSVTYFGFDQREHQGALVVNKRIASDVESIFAELDAIRFPINKIDAWEKYGPDVYADQNITVSFYCEKADDAPTEWSSHAYGMAIDINPLFNPFLDLQHNWWPKGAARYVPRDRVPAKVSTQSQVFQIFTRHGWAWGGFDAGVPDYMHFNKVTVGDGAKMDRPYMVTGLQYIPKGPEEAAKPK